MGGASRAIGRLGVEVVLVTALSLIAVAASAGVSLGVRISVKSLIALVTMNDAPVALENLQDRDKDRLSRTTRLPRYTSACDRSPVCAARWDGPCKQRPDDAGAQREAGLWQGWSL